MMMSEFINHSLDELSSNDFNTVKKQLLESKNNNCGNSDNVMVETKTIKLSNMDDLSTTGKVYLWEEPKDNLGDDYNNGLLFYTPYDKEEECSIDYYLGKQYKTLSGRLVRSFEDRSASGKQYFVFYGGGKVLYESEALVKSIKLINCCCYIKC